MDLQIKPLALAVAMSSLSSFSIAETTPASSNETVQSETVVNAEEAPSETVENSIDVPVESTSDPLSVQFTEAQAASLDFSTFNAFKQSLSAVLQNVLPQDIFVSVSQSLQLPSEEAETETDKTTSSETMADVNELFDGFFAAQESDDFSALSYKKEILLNLGSVYGFEVSFSVKATEAIADESADPEIKESGAGNAGAIAGMAGIAGVGLAAGGGGGGSSSSSTFLNSGTSLTYDATLLTTWQNRTEFDNVNLYSSRNISSSYTNSSGATTTLSSSDIHPYVLLGVDDAYAYGLSGAGQTVGILDGGIVSSHVEKANSDITTYGSISNATAGSSHGAHVAGLIAANYDGDSSSFVPDEGLGSYTGDFAPLNNGMMGVAYGAKLFIADYNGRSADMFGPDHWADVYSNAVTNNAVAMNNSWGWREAGSDNELPITTITSYMTANGATLAEALQNYSPYSGQSATDWQDFIDALNTYQNTGVIVWAQSNDYSFNEIDMSAGLPVADSSLADAWIAVVNINVEGSSISSSSVKRISGKCGSAAAFCLAADGVRLTSLDDDTTVDYNRGTGTSMAAPQISGMVALLSEAFPTLTPAQITDRLLASANNSFFTADDTTTFANGITHGYNSEFGHGIPDMYAALNPITTSRAQKAILVGDNASDARRFDLDSTQASFGPAFGNSIQQSLSGESAFFHDGLNTPFRFNYASITPSGNDQHKGQLAAETKGASSQASQGLLSFKSDLSATEAFDGNQSLVIESGSGFTDSKFFLTNNVPLAHYTTDPSKLGPSIHSTPYTLAATNGNTAGLMVEQGEAHKSFFAFFRGQSELNELETSGVSFAHDIQVSEQSAISLETGYVNEVSGFLDSGVSSAFASDSQGETIFSTISAFTSFAGNMMVRSTASLGYTRLTAEQFGLIDKISPVTSSMFAVELVKPVDDSGTRQVFAAISQPLRVERADVTFRVPNAIDNAGNLSFTSVNTNAEPSGRQIDFSLGYAQKFDGGAVSLVANASDDTNHIQSNDLEFGLKMGVEFQF